MTISVTDVRRLLGSRDPEAVLVLIEGRTEVVAARELGSERYRGALRVISRPDLIEQAGGEELSDHEVAEQAAILDTEVSELGG
jgi:hypothetical protein